MTKVKEKQFYSVQTPITASKILIYKEYLKDYLPKVLMQYGKCFIADFFCGPGMNGKKKGSPLILLDEVEHMLASPILRRKWPTPEIIIFFSDANNEYKESLDNILSKNKWSPEIKIIGPFCAEFAELLNKSKKIFQNIDGPKFFFLDPFTYSDVSINDVKVLIESPTSEILLFLPTFHSYRFKSRSDQHPKLKNFLDQFTDETSKDVVDISDFNESIRQKFLSCLGLKYGRAIRLDDGSKKNALFYLTKHVTGMIVMNRLVWKFTEDGETVSTARDDNPALFDFSTMSDSYERNKQFLQQYLQEKKSCSNVEIIDIVAQNGFINKYAGEILKDFRKRGLIEVEYLQKDKKRGFYVADNNWNKELAIIKYKG